MDAHYDPVSSNAYAGWDGSAVASFRGGMRFGEPLVLLHELGHWFQKRSRVEWAINNMLVRGFVSENEQRKQELYRKALAARALLRPYGEGLSLYMQYDYFPANYFGSFGPRCEIDALAEVIVSQRFSFQKYDRLDIQELGRLAASFFRGERLCLRTLQKKMSVLSNPLRVGQDHILGYLFIKRVIANIKSFSVPYYLHDEAILQSLIRHVFEEPALIELLLDDALDFESFINLFAAVLKKKLNQLVQNRKIGRTFWAAVDDKYAIRNRKRESQRLGVCDRRYGDLCKSLLFGLRQSVEDYLQPHETLAEYEERYAASPGPLPFPIDAISLLLAMDAVKFGSFNVTLRRENDSWYVEFDEHNLRLPLSGFGTESPRAGFYHWTIEPNDGQRARLVEVLFLHRGDFFHVSFLDCERGLLYLWHSTDDYNIGYRNIAVYLEEPHRIDRLLGALKADVQALEQGSLGRTDQLATRSLVKQLYRKGEESLLTDLGLKPHTHWRNKGLIRIKDIFDVRC
jgi:hypothetical protein